MRFGAVLGTFLWLALAPRCLLAQAVELERRASEGKPAEFLSGWNLTLSPAREPVPALKYSLWIRYGERRYGDATPHYYRAAVMFEGLPQELNKQYEERWQKWRGNEDPDLASQAEMRKWLDAHRKVIEELEIAAYCDRLELDLRLGELRGLAAIQFLLPEIQAMRDLARMLAVKIRLEVAERRFEQAIETMRIGFRLSEAASKPPTIINDLVGIAIASMMTHELTRLVSVPDAPNLYWAMASLPRPVIDLRKSLDFESRMIYQIYPFLKDAETARRTPDEWNKLVLDSYLQLHELSGDYPEKPKPLTEAAANELMKSGYTAAKASLLADGFPAKDLESMPTGQVIAIFTARSYRLIYDELSKWTLLLPEEARQRWNPTNDHLRQRGFLGPQGWNDKLLPTASMLLPNMPNVWFSPLRLERELAALRTIEAIRMHLAEHGALPKTLDEIQLVPVPKDPMFGKPFEYRQEGEAVVLETLPRPGIEPGQHLYRYVLRLPK